MRGQAIANADVSRAHRFLAEGDEKYRSKDYAGAAAQYRRAASIFDAAMAVLAEDEVACFDDVTLEFCKYLVHTLFVCRVMKFTTRHHYRMRVMYLRCFATVTYARPNALKE